MTRDDHTSTDPEQRFPLAHMRAHYNRAPQPIAFEDLRPHWPHKWWQLMIDVFTETFVERLPSMLQRHFKEVNYGKFARGGTVSRNVTMEFPTLLGKPPVNIASAIEAPDIRFEDRIRRVDAKPVTVEIINGVVLANKEIETTERIRRKIEDEIRRGGGPGANADKWKDWP